jgi:hypothetical protein
MAPAVVRPFGMVTLPNTREGKRHAKQSSARLLRESVIA